MLDSLKQQAQRLKLETYALYLAARDPGTPWLARLLVAAIVAYALSPIDLIPDFIPLLGYLDDLILLPLAMLLAIRMIPADVMAECRERAQRITAAKTSGWPVALVVILIWLLLGMWLVSLAFPLWQ